MQEDLGLRRGVQRDGMIILPGTDELDDLVAGGSNNDPIVCGGGGTDGNFVKVPGL